MKKAIKDCDAIKFSVVFYSHLARGESIEQAFSYASETTQKSLTSTTEYIATLIKKDN
jgi:hypothetical protein